MGQWANYFVATAGAAAGLTGLIFVGISLNLKKILSIAHLPGRGLISLILLTNILLISSFCLVPLQSAWWPGGGILLAAICVWVTGTWLDVTAFKIVEKKYKRHYIFNITFTQIALLPYLASGICFFEQSENGYYWLITGITFSFIKSLTDAWVLLIEINR